MRRDNHGRLSPHIGDYHKRLHEQGKARYLEMKKLRDQGYTPTEIAEACNTSRQNVSRIFKRYEGVE